MLTNEQQQMVIRGQGLIHLAIRRFMKISPKHRFYDDMVSMSNHALARAAKTYDSSKGVSFSTYAILIIRRELWRHATSQRTYGMRLVPADHRDFMVGSYSQSLHDGEDFIAGDKEDIDAQIDFQTYLSILDNRRRQCLILCYVEGMTLEEAGKVLGITKERVRQLNNSSLQKIEKRFGESLKLTAK